MLEIVKKELVCEPEEGVGVGGGVTVWVGVGAGVDVVSVKDQTVLQLLHISDVSLAFTLQYHFPSVSV